MTLTPDSWALLPPGATISRGFLAVLIVMAAVLLAQACGDSTGVTPPSSPHELEIVSGNGQRAANSHPLAAPLRVRVTGSDEQPVSGATVQWSLTEGQATFEPAQSSTNAAGEAETHVTLGATVGAVAVRATVGSLAPVTFSIRSLDPLAFTALSAGAGFTCALTVTGAAFCWGYNGFGRLGDGTAQDQTSPVPVAGGLRFVALSAASQHACGVTTAGAAYCWGLNRYGQLGDGTLTDRWSPVPVAGGLTFLAVSSGGTFTCGVTTAAAVYCWGENPYGVLGDGTTIQRLTPVLVQTGVTFTAVSAGSFFACGLTAEGVAHCWGGNAYGQLGDGTSTDRMTPGPIAGGLIFAELSAGQGGWNPTCGITIAGVAYCWGPNFNGALGDGTTTPQMRPVAVTGGVTFVSLDVGAGHACGLTAEGTAYCWGWNRYAQLGDGTTTDQTMPVPVGGGLRFVALSGGLHHSCSLTEGGDVYCWGSTAPGEGAPLTLTPTKVDR